MGSLTKQPMRAGRETPARLAGHGEHVPTLVEGVARRDETAAALRALDDHHGIAHAGDDAVARREAPRPGRHTPPELREQQAVALYGGEQSRVGARVDHVGAATQHSHRGRRLSAGRDAPSASA